jgi:hypothetical protein
MESRRKECLKYKLDSRLPEDWSRAEAIRTTGLESYGKDYIIAEKAFSDALELYEDILKRSFADIFLELDADVAAARASAVAVGADTYYPDHFALAEETAGKIPLMRENCEYTNAYDTSQLAILRYNTLQRCIESVLLRQDIDRSGVSSLLGAEYDAAGLKYEEAVSLYGLSDAAALDAALTSIALYSSIGRGEYALKARESKAKADEIRIQADSVMSQKSMKEVYAKALKDYGDGDVQGASKAWEAAAASYEAAAAGFALAYQETLLKRNRAEAAIAAAKERQTASTELARKADTLAPLPDNAEGFSETELDLSGEEK